MAVSGIDKLHAVLGGFHLGVAPPDYVEHTIGELTRISQRCGCIGTLDLRKSCCENGLSRRQGEPDADRV